MIRAATLFVLSAVCSAAICPLAQADPQDDQLISSLSAAGIPVNDPVALEGIAHDWCSTLPGGLPMLGLDGRLAAQGLDMGQMLQFYRLADKAYCPGHGGPA